MVKIKNRKVVKFGKSYGITIPISLIRSEVVDFKKKYDLKLVLHNGN